MNSKNDRLLAEKDIKKSKRQDFRKQMFSEEKKVFCSEFNNPRRRNIPKATRIGDDGRSWDRFMVDIFKVFFSMHSEVREILSREILELKSTEL